MDQLGKKKNNKKNKKKDHHKQVSSTFVLPKQLSLILKDAISRLLFKWKKKVFQQCGKNIFLKKKLKPWNVIKWMRLTVYLQCTALPGHSLLCPQFAQVPWYHSKKWRSGLLTQRSHCTDPYNQDLPTSIGDSPKKNRSKKIISESVAKMTSLPN